MAPTSQSESLMMRRLAREAGGSRSTGSRGANVASDYFSDRDQFAPGNLEEDVAHSIRAIERVVENFGVLKENFHFYKDLVTELREKLDEEKAQREDMNRELVGLERTVKSERDRAARAEHSAKASEGVIRDLEHQLASLQSQTGRLVKAISLLVSAEIDVRGDDDADGSLRLVS